MTLVSQGPPKLCPKCGFKRPREDFYAFRRGDLVYAHTLCKEHANASRVKDANANPDARLATRQRYRRNRRKDPERHAIDLDYRREWYRRKFNISTDRYRTSRYMQDNRATDRAKVTAEPFGAWLSEIIDRDESTYAATALRLGLAERTVRACCLGEQVGVELATVERALIADGTTMLWELYGDLFEEAA